MKPTIITLLGLALAMWSCKETQTDGMIFPDGAHEMTSIEFTVSASRSTPQSQGTRALGPTISSPQELDSLIKDLRIMVFDNTGICRNYADFNPLHLSLSNKLRLNVPTGTNSFIFVTNVGTPAIMSTDIVGKTNDELLLFLDTIKVANTIYFKPAKDHFFGKADNIVVSSNPATIPIYNITLSRMVAQLDTRVHINQVWKESAKTTLMRNYIKSMRSNVVKFISTDISMSKRINTDPEHRYGTDTSVIINNSWQMIENDTTARSVTIAFPTEGMNTHPALLLAAEVSPTAPGFVADSRDQVLPNGNVIRYWWYQIQNFHFRENVRLELTITALIGQGSPVPPPPDAEATIEFTITVKDWDSVIDTEGGNKDDFT